MDTAQDSDSTDSAERSEEVIAEKWELCSAVKVDVSDVSVVSDYKVLVVSHDSTTQDVIHSLLRKLHMKEYDSQTFVIQAELFSQTEIAVLQFEDSDKLMHAYNHFPKGSLSLYLRRKMEASENVKRDADKTSLNGHQLTIQRIRRSLEKLKRKSTAVSGEKPASSHSSGHAKEQGRDDQKVEKPDHSHMIKADELYKEPRREHRGRQGRPRKHDISTPRSDKKLASSESLRSDKPRGHSKAGPASLHSESMYQFQGSTYKTSTLPQGGTMVSVDTDCMIFYDNTSDAGSIHSMPVPSTHSHPTTRAHIMPHHLNHKSDLHLSKHSSATIDKKIHAFRNLEDSGIDVKSPPQVPAQQTSHPQRNGALQSTGKERPGGSSCDAEVMRALQSQNSFLSPTLSDSSPFSLSGGTEVKRSGSFSSMKSLPVNMYKDNSTPNSFTFETIDHRDDLRSKSQSCTNLTRTKVVRRRSLPPLDVSQEKLEQKKTSLSKRLARKINRYRENEKRYPVLPSPHSFSTQNTKKPPDPDDMSLADMEVAHILEGKPEHPTDSDVEDYLACVESAEPQTTAKSKKTSKPHKDTVQQQSEDMEKSGYYRYRNSAKLERQQKQDTAELTQSDTHSKGEVTKENPQTHKPKSLNKFVDQSMKSFLHHCHDVNMVSKHDTLELHQAALHGVLPTSPSAQTHNPLEARSPTKVTDSHNMKSRHSPTKSHTHYSAKRPTELHTTGLLPQSPTKTADHQSPLKSPNTQKHSPVRTSLTSSRTSAYKSPSDSPLKNSTKAYVQSPTKSVAQNSAKSSIQSPTKPPSQSPTKTLPQSPAKVAEYLSLDKPLHSISERDSYPVHNSTKASGYSSTSHMIHGSQNRSGSLHTQSESSSKGNQRTVAQIQMSAPHPSNESKVLTHIVDNIRNAKIASKYAVEDRLEINTSKTDDIHKHSDTSVSDPQEVSTKNQHMERIVQDIPDGSVNSKKYSLHVTHNGNRENQKDTNAFNCKGSYYQSQSTDGLKKMHNESHTDSQTVFEELENQSNHQTQSQYLYSCDSIPDKVQHSSGSHVKSGVTSAQMNSQEIVTLPGAVREVNTSTSQCGQQKIDVSDCKSNGSRPPPYSVDGGEGVVLKSLNLFSLVSSHMLCAVYLEKTTGQSYGICVRRGEFRETRQAWHVEDTPVYSVVQITELQPQSPAQASKGKLLPGDIIVEVNGHSVLQSSDKVVRTLLDARTSLHLVVGRPHHREHPDTVDNLDILNLTFDNMEQIPADFTTDHNTSQPLTTTDHKSDRSKAYQTLSAEERGSHHIQPAGSNIDQTISGLESHHNQPAVNSCYKKLPVEGRAGQYSVTDKTSGYGGTTFLL